MKKNKMTLACAVLAGSMLLASCTGSFKLWNGMKNWNDGVGSKFVNELVFVALHIVPVYELAYLGDILIMNSIEFWSGSNPVASNKTKEVKGENGDYLITYNDNGYTITNQTENLSMDLVYNPETQTWNAVNETENIELVKMNDNGTVSINMQNGTSMTVMPDMQGVASVRAAIGSSVFFASR